MFAVSFVKSFMKIVLSFAFLRQTISYRIGITGGSDWSKDDGKGVSTTAFALLRSLARKRIIYAPRKEKT
jgi:hypothetical protein